MSKKEKFLALVSPEETNTVAKAKERVAKRAYSRMAKSIAIVILARLEMLNWKQSDLAEKMEVSPQQISKWLKGDENLTLETIAKLSKVLDHDLIAINNLQTTKEEVIVVTEKSKTLEIQYNEACLELANTFDYSQLGNNILRKTGAESLVAMKYELPPIKQAYQEA